MPGARCTRSLVCIGRKHTSIHHRSTGTPGIPARNGFNGFLRDLPGDRLVATVASGLRRVRARSGRHASANLTPASGRQDHTTSPSAATSLASVLSIAHRPKPALQPRCAQNAAASTASRPASVTIAIRPSVGWDAKSSRCDLGWTETEIFLQRGLDTPVNKPPVGQISSTYGWV